MHDGFIPNNEEKCCEVKRKKKTVAECKLEKDLDEYIHLYEQEKMLRGDAERELKNLKKRYAMQSVPLTKAAVNYITNVISTTRTALGWGALLSFFAFILMVGAGANMEAHGVEPLSPMYPFSAFLSGVICLLITIFMPDKGTTYDLINGYRNTQLTRQLYDAGLLDDDQYVND